MVFFKLAKIASPSLMLVAACLVAFMACKTESSIPVNSPDSAVTVTVPDQSTRSAAESPIAGQDQTKDAPSTGSTVDASGTTKDASLPSADNQPPTAEMMTPKVDQSPMTWTTSRWVILAPGGPILFELAINLDRQDVDQALAGWIDQVSMDLEKELPKPWTWEKLLDHRWIQSGWLGNLVPNADQRREVLAMYNNDGNETVEATEFAAFLTRGLSRGSAIRFTDIGNEPSPTGSDAWLGPLDANRDNQLDGSEVDAAELVVNRLDTNGDRIVNLEETRTATLMANMTPAATSLLENTSTVLFEGKKAKGAAGRVLQHYTFLEAIERQEFWAIGEARWKSIDSNNDGQVSVNEIVSMESGDPDVRVEVQFASDTANPPKMTVSCRRPELQFNTLGGGRGQLRGPSIAVDIAINDTFNDLTRRILRQQLVAARNNPAVAAALQAQLQLGPMAMELVDANQDKQVDDAEFERIWNWLSRSRMYRCLARWVAVADNGWFIWFDQDGDNRIIEREKKLFRTLLGQLDRDSNGAIQVSEFPMTSRIEINRTDDRLSNVGIPTTQEGVTATLDWFGASDTNADGSVSMLEFLGNSDDFKGYDRNNDGFISRQEAIEVE